MQSHLVIYIVFTIIAIQCVYLMKLLDVEEYTHPILVTFCGFAPRGGGKRCYEACDAEILERKEFASCVQHLESVLYRNVVNILHFHPR